MQTINSISEISRVLPTNGSNPVVVLAEDYYEYVCKYSNNTPSNLLLIEYLGYAFANIWGIPIPPGRFVNILDEHVPNEILSARIQRTAFHKPTIGSQVIEASKEIDKTVIVSWKAKKAQLKKLINKEDFLKIGLFDLWLTNEDRNHNNSNLLVTAVDSGMKIVAIDHEKCFNSGSINPAQAPYQLTQDESILATEITPLLFEQGAGFDTIKNNLIAEFPVWVAQCQSQMVQILEPIPASWGINRESLEEYLNSHIFVPNWRTETEQSFRQYIDSSFV